MKAVRELLNQQKYIYVINLLSVYLLYNNKVNSEQGGVNKNTLTSESPRGNTVYSSCCVNWCFNRLWQVFSATVKQQYSWQVGEHVETCRRNTIVVSSGSSCAENLKPFSEQQSTVFTAHYIPKKFKSRCFLSLIKIVFF